MSVYQVIFVVISIGYFKSQRAHAVDLFQISSFDYPSIRTTTISNPATSVNFIISFYFKPYTLPIAAGSDTTSKITLISINSGYLILNYSYKIPKISDTNYGAAYYYVNFDFTINGTTPTPNYNHLYEIDQKWINITLIYNVNEVSLYVDYSSSVSSTADTNFIITDYKISKL